MIKLIKNLKYLALLLGLCFTSCKSQEKKEMLSSIDSSKLGLEAIMNFNIGIGPASDTDFSPTDDKNFEVVNLKSVNENTLTNFFSKLSVSNDLVYPYNLIAVDKDEFELIKILKEDNFYFSDNADMQPTFTPVKFVFLDGTQSSSPSDFISQQTLKAKYSRKEKEDGKTYDVVDEEKMSAIEKQVWNASGFKSTIALSSSKPLESITYQIDLPIGAKKAYPMNNKDQKLESQYGTIRVDSIVGNKVSEVATFD